MLTTGQIDAVRSAILDNDDLYGSTKDDALESLAAYKSVAELLDGYDASDESDEVLNAEVHDAFLKGQRKVIEELRRVLRGK